MWFAWKEKQSFATAGESGESGDEIPLGTCFRDTGGTCRFFSCDASRGEVASSALATFWCDMWYAVHRALWTGILDNPWQSLTILDILLQATCERRRCKCKPGFCNHHGSCVSETQANRSAATITRSLSQWHALTISHSSGASATRTRPAVSLVALRCWATLLASRLG